MEEFTPETLQKYISQNRQKKNIEPILNKLRERETKTDLIPTQIKEIDSQIRENFAEIIRFFIKNNQKEKLKLLLTLLRQIPLNHLISLS